MYIKILCICMYIYIYNQKFRATHDELNIFFNIKPNLLFYHIKFYCCKCPETITKWDDRIPLQLQCFPSQSSFVVLHSLGSGAGIPSV